MDEANAAEAIVNDAAAANQPGDSIGALLAKMELAAVPAEVMNQVPDVPAPEDIIAGGPMKIELRGYEVARRVTSIKMDNGNVIPEEHWEVTGSFRPSRIALSQAMADAKWMQARWPNETYRVRPIVSLEPLPTAEAPLTLDEDSPQSNDLPAVSGEIGGD